MAKVAPLEQVGDPTESQASHGGKTSATEGRGSLVHVAVNEWRHFMHWSGWYDSGMAISLKRFLRGKSFAVVTMFALFMALFFADLCIIMQLSTNMVADVTLTIVLIIFAFEFFGLALTDASYLFSFFFWMDLLGTVSMILDISFMLGKSATQAETYSGQKADENLIVVRAARATKLGARAGRLSRVMKLLRYLPFVNNPTDDSDVKMARVISNQLTNVLSTRVAFLTICIVVFLPIFHMFTYPEVDDSMSAWTQLLSGNAQEWQQICPVGQSCSPAQQALKDAAFKRLEIELERFASFYASVSYGPFAVCYGTKQDDGGFNCAEHHQPPFDSTFDRPGRNGSIREINEESFQTKFDLSTPKQLEAVAGVGLICFIIIVMCVFGLVTSSSISVIALQPLERMLSVVRQRCKQIFKYTNDLQDEDSDAEEDEDYDDTEQASEFVLLEKVVSKLAAIAHLSTTKDEPEMKEGMTENEVMVLNWMQGTQVPVHKRGPSTGRFSSSASGPHEITEGTEHVETPREQSMVQSTLHAITSDITDSLETPHFNSLDLTKEMKLSVAAYIVLSADAPAVWIRTTVQESHLFKFVSNCEAKYQANPFHNFSHALDVEYAVARFMALMQAERFLPESSMFWLMIAAVAHDLGHLGVNNQYLIETSHELALKYNDRSPLENMHCATLFQVVSDPESNVFAQVEKDLYKEMRKGIINAILHTDVTKHNDMMKELALLYQMNSEAFDESILEMNNAVVEVLQSNSQLALNALLHGADVGNPMKPWDLAQRIAYLCIDEFFAQGDLEKTAGIPVQMLNDRDKVNRPNSQIGFIEFVIAPMVESIVHLFPPLDGLAENLGINVKNWFDVWVEQSTPAAEAQAKTNTRVQKVIARCQAVMRPEKAHGSVIVHE
mmetsp:Transcript_148874/g.277512  ORF Transcript_148874/g.277512 Transcript_148874/m.277512 type:complete len:897 (-) Transcript_148874:200-2890(-)